MVNIIVWRILEHSEKRDLASNGNFVDQQQLKCNIVDLDLPPKKLLVIA